MQIEKLIAKKVKENGGQSYYVGGYVRDEILGIENKDVDIEIHNISQDKLLEILKEIGTPLSYGKSFGVYSLKGYDIDIVLPRTETKTGNGHKDFDVDINPYINTTQAIQRRDFTINGIYKNVVDGKYIDPFNGRIDIEKKIIRYIDKDKFPEDPLRVLRACQFASRFNFRIDNKTINLCKNIDTTTLSKQRVEDELKKALLKGKPSIFFKYLEKMNQNKYWFKEIKIVNDKCIKYRNNVNKPYEYMLTNLCIDLSKKQTINLLNRIISKKQTIDYVLNMHDLINRKLSNDYSIYKMFDESIDASDLIYLRMIKNNKDKFLFKKLDEYKDVMSKPYVKGKDIMHIKTKNKENYSKALKYSHTLRLKKIEYNKVLELTIKYLNKCNLK